jgi:hypothetical protein
LANYLATQANNGDERIGRRGPRNLLELLPDTFTIEDAARVRQQQGLDSKKTRNMISAWKNRQYILQMTDDSFQKLRFKFVKQKKSGPSFGGLGFFSYLRGHVQGNGYQYHFDDRAGHEWRDGAGCRRW